VLCRAGGHCGQPEQYAARCRRRENRFLVKQAEEPWFQTEWAFAEKAARRRLHLIKIAVPDGEKTLSAIDSLAANGAKGFVICPPDVSLGPAIMAKAKLNGLKVIAVDDRFVDASGKFMEDVPYLGMAAFEVGQKQGARWPPKRKTQLGLERHLRGDQHLQRTRHRQETHRRFDQGARRRRHAEGPHPDRRAENPRRAGQHGRHQLGAGQAAQRAKNLIIGGMNDNTVLGGVRATEAAGFAAANVIGIGINGTDAIGELKKAQQRLLRLDAASPHIEGYNTAEMMYEWVTTGKEPPKYTAMDDVTLITRANFKQELEKIGLWN
jgi:L-arabinose transport system substrate-binding protein